MWTRREIKAGAKEFLRKNYIQAFIVCLIVSLLTGSFYRNRVYDHRNMGWNQHHELNQGARDYLDDGYDQGIRSFASYNFPKVLRISILPMIFLGFGLVSMVLGLLIKFFILNVLEVGQASFFLEGLESRVEVSRILAVFSQDNYLQVVLTQFLKNIYIFLWSLLFFIPGIVKHYEYKMIPYILAENTSIDKDQAFYLSRQMTYGHKLDMFILDLSFIGWYILGSLALGLGHLFVNPYVEASYANLYDRLKREI